MPKYVKINATASGRLGGLARAQKLTEKQRKAQARTANKARWDKYYLENPDRVRPTPKRKRGAK